MEMIMNWLQMAWAAIQSGAISLWTDVLQPFGSAFWEWLTTHMAWLPEGAEWIYNLVYKFFLLRLGLRVATLASMVLLGAVILLFCAIIRIFRRSRSRRRF